MVTTGPAGRWVGRRRPALAAMSIGVAADWLLGEPPAAWHPVGGFGRAMTWLEGRCYADSRWAGAAYALAGTTGAAAAGWLLAGPAAAGAMATRRSVAAGAVATYVAVAGRQLGAVAGGIGAALEAGDLDGARAQLPALVGRDPTRLDAAEVVRAVIESVAENTVDAVVAAAVWAAVGGAPAVLAYRAVNTLDAMVGHCSARYARFGWAAARADDAANWIPARLTALLVAAVRPRAAAAIWRAVRDQAGAHPSPNAGVAEAAFAAALNLRLGGSNVYGGQAEMRPILGTGVSPDTVDIRRAVTLHRQVVAVVVAAGLLATRGGRSV
jgi:adenosylcobinamide-phosphate synthase